MKKVALVAFDGIRLGILRGIADLLQRKGINVCGFTHSGQTNAKYPCVQESWMNMRFKKIDDFGPDKVIMFNGFAVNAAPATHILRHRYPTFHVEFGWLPQKNNLYIDHWGINSDGYWAKEGVAMLVSKYGQKDHILSKLRALYNPCKPGELAQQIPFISDGNGYLKDYYAVAMQIETDTTVVYHSPFIKTMEGLILAAKALVKRTGLPLVVKGHPKSKDNERLAAFCASIDDVFFTLDCRMSDLVAYSKGLIGLNSTTTVEAMAHGNIPVYNLATNVLFNDIELAYKNLSPSNFMQGPNYPKDVKARLSALYQVQFNATTCPDWVFEYILSESAENLDMGSSNE